MKIIAALSIGLVTLSAQSPAFENASITRALSVTELISQMKAAPPVNTPPPTAADRTPGDETPVVELSGVHDGTLTLRSIPLTSLIQTAYRVGSYQLAGLSDLGEDRFNLVAKIPDGTSTEQVPEMLQRLLADRFRLVAHRETRETPVYVLISDRDGPAVNGSVLITRGMVRPVWDDRLPWVLVDGPSGSARLRPTVGGPWLEISGMTMGTLALTLTSLLEVPVVDRTGLTVTYEIFLKWPSSQGLVSMRRGLLHQLGATRTGSPAASLDDDAAAAAMLDALGKVGLTVEIRQEPLEVVVIDSVQRTPTDN